MKSPSLRTIGLLFLGAWFVALIYVGSRLDTVGAISRVVVRRILQRNNASSTTSSTDARAVEQGAQAVASPAPDLAAALSPRSKSLRHARKVVIVELDAGDEAGDGGGAQSPSGAEEESRPTMSTAHCAMWGTYTEACYYTDVCFDPVSRTLLLLGDEESVRATGWRPNTDGPLRTVHDNDVALRHSDPLVSALDLRDPGAEDARAATAPHKTHASHNDLLTGQVLPLQPLATWDPHKPKLFPFNSNMRGRFLAPEEADELWAPHLARWKAQRDTARRRVLAAQLSDSGRDGAAVLDALLAELDGTPPQQPGSGTAAAPQRRKLLAAKGRAGSGRKGAAGSGRRGAGDSSTRLSRAAAAEAERAAVRAARPVDPFSPPVSVRTDAPSAAGDGAAAAAGTSPPERHHTVEPSPDEAVDDVAWIASNKIELANIWYFSSRVTPWFEARSLNSSGMLPFSLPQPAYVYLQTSARRVSSDWHNSMLALSLGFPKHVLFPGRYAPPTAIEAAEAGVTEADYVANGRQQLRRLVPPVDVSATGEPFWMGMRVPTVLYRSPAVAAAAAAQRAAEKAGKSGAAGGGDEETVDEALQGGPADAADSGAADNGGAEGDGEAVLTQAQLPEALPQQRSPPRSAVAAAGRGHNGAEAGASGRGPAAAGGRRPPPPRDPVDETAPVLDAAALPDVLGVARPEEVRPLGGRAGRPASAAASRPLNDRLVGDVSAPLRAPVPRDADNEEQRLVPAAAKRGQGGRDSLPKEAADVGDGGDAAAAGDAGSRVNGGTIDGDEGGVPELPDGDGDAAAGAPEDGGGRPDADGDDGAGDGAGGGDAADAGDPDGVLGGDGAASLDAAADAVAGLDGDSAAGDAGDRDGDADAAPGADLPRDGGEGDGGDDAAAAVRPARRLLAVAERRAAAPLQGRTGQAPAPARVAAPADAAAPELDEAATPEGKTRCFRRLVITGASGYLFGDVRTASMFRVAALRAARRIDQPPFIGPGMPQFFQHALAPKRVLLIDRKPGRPRNIVNVDAIKRLLRAYDVPFTHVMDFKGPFEDQVRLYNDHGILLGVHGAGFINCIFMRQGSAVIEVFPYHVKHTLYAREAFVAGLTHFPVYATDPTLTFKIGGSAHRAYVAAGCEAMPSVVTQWQNNACRGPLIAGRVAVPMRGLEEALVNALDTIGYRTEYLGLFQDEPLWVRPLEQPEAGPAAVALAVANATEARPESARGGGDAGGSAAVSAAAPMEAENELGGQDDRGQRQRQRRRSGAVGGGAAGGGKVSGRDEEEPPPGIDA